MKFYRKKNNWNKKRNQIVDGLGILYLKPEKLGLFFLYLTNQCQKLIFFFLWGEEKMRTENNW